MTDLERLQAARRGIEQSGGWCQGCGYDGDGGRCLVVWVQTVDLPWDEPMTLEQGIAYSAATKEAMPALMLLHQLAGVTGLAGWNDAPTTTKADVLALLDAGIAIEAAKTAGYTVEMSRC